MTKPTTSPNPRLLRTAAAAVYCGSSASSFTKYRIWGTGPTFIKVGGNVVYDVADLDAWLASRRRTSTSQPIAKLRPAETTQP
jgi:predicted DNA-binding transcriptional regulator AlpA